MAARETPRSVLVVGAGLIGTSVALALRERGHRLALDDVSAAHLRVALGMTGAVRYGGEAVDVALVSVPPAETGGVVADVLRGRRAAAVTDTASIKLEPLRVVAAQVDRSLQARYVGGHPLAGRERSGPRAARADLFAGRPWVLTPSADATPGAVRAARWLARQCGATPVVMDAAEHDHAVAVTSHAPQVIASALASRLAAESDAVVRLVGQGLRDMTRIATSDPDLWAAIVAGNASPLAAELRRLAERVDAVAGALEDSPSAGAAAVRELMLAGHSGRRRMPGKHGGKPQAYRAVPVVVPDRPGQLARLFADVAEAGVNVEDVRVDHAPGLPMGVIELYVAPDAAAGVSATLVERGWTVIASTTADA